MDCKACREAISALLDDEDPGTDPTLVDAHLVGCAACRADAAQASRLQGWLRPAEPVPDLTRAILARIAQTEASRRHGDQHELAGLGLAWLLAHPSGRAGVAGR
jgi:predicted anti-sigma-YlaC factor YlaD